MAHWAVVLTYSPAGVYTDPLLAPNPCGANENDTSSTSWYARLPRRARHAALHRERPNGCSLSTRLRLARGRHVLVAQRWERLESAEAAIPTGPVQSLSRRYPSRSQPGPWSA